MRGERRGVSPTWNGNLSNHVALTLRRSPHVHVELTLRRALSTSIFAVLP